MEQFDVVILGSGPAGERAADTAAFFGKRVAVVEKQAVVGGASANTGTLPSKTLRETALALSGLKARKLYGVDLSLRRQATIRDFMYHEQRVKESERNRIRAGFRQWRVSLFQGAGRFVDPHTIAIAGPGGTETRIAGEKIVIATGSSPYRLPGFEFDSDRVHDSDEILALRTLPARLAIVGAGVIGSEYACTFAALGVEVHLLDGRAGLLTFLDEEVSSSLREAMQGLGIIFHQPQKVSTCTVRNEDSVELVCESGLHLTVDGVLVAAGRVSNTAALNLSAAGIAPGERGLLSVNKHFQTSAPHVYAVGDVIGFPALAATSAEQGRVAMCHAFDQTFKTDVAPILPTGIYTIPEVSMAGETEHTLREKGIRYIAVKAHYRDNARGKIIGDKEGYLKLLFAWEDLRLLGVHVIGEHATEIVHVGLVAMMTGANASIFNETCFNYPTLGDLYKDATYQAMAIRSGLLKPLGAQTTS